MNPQETHVFVVDDEPTVLTAFQRALESGGMQVSVFSCAEDCLAALPEKPCDVIVTDIRLGNRDGLSLLQEVKHSFPWLRVLIVTAYGDIPLTVAAMRAGATDFLEKPVDRQDLLAAIRQALQTDVGPVSWPREPLSSAETQVLRFFLEGKTSRETAVLLNRSTRTIEAHRQRIMRKFGVHNAVQLTRKAGALWLDDESADQRQDEGSGKEHARGAGRPSRRGPDG
jgi:FixJ family two-component response regulator